MLNFISDTVMGIHIRLYCIPVVITIICTLENRNCEMTVHVYNVYMKIYTLVVFNKDVAITS